MQEYKYEFEKTNDPFFDTPEELIRKKLELLQLKDGDVLVDLGCGKAQSLIEATKIAKIKGIGYETLPEALEIARENVLEAGVEDLIEIKDEDMFEADLRSVTAVFLYLTRTALGSLSLKLEEELPIGARIVTHDFDLPAWEIESEVEVLTSTGEIKSIFTYCKRG